MRKNYETVGDIRSDVDTLVAAQGLRIVGGSFYPHIKSLTFGLEGRNQQRKGDAICMLPGGWQGNTYWPNFMGDWADPHDALKLNVIQGAGRLAIPMVGKYDLLQDSSLTLDLDEEGRAAYHLINTTDELLVVHALSTRYPQNATDVNRSGTRELADSTPLASDVTYNHDETFEPHGEVIFEVRE